MSLKLGLHSLTHTIAWRNTHGQSCQINLFCAHAHAVRTHTLAYTHSNTQTWTYTHTKKRTRIFTRLFWFAPSRMFTHNHTQTDSLTCTETIPEGFWFLLQTIDLTGHTHTHQDTHTLLSLQRSSPFCNLSVCFIDPFGAVSLCGMENFEHNKSPVSCQDDTFVWWMILWWR